MLKNSSLKVNYAALPSVFISYKRESAGYVDQIEKSLQLKARVRRDTNDLRTNDSIKDFMDTIRMQDFAVFVISDKYLKSLACMYEAWQFMKESDWRKRSVFVVMNDVKQSIFTEEKQKQYVSYWDKKCSAWENEIRKLPTAAGAEQVRKLKIARDILNHIGEFLDVIADTNTSTEDTALNIVPEYISHTILNKKYRILRYFSGRNVLIGTTCLAVGVLAVFLGFHMIPRSVVWNEYNLYETDICTYSYEGMVSWNRPSGEGTLEITWNNGETSRYTGQFRNGYPNGSGHYYYVDGTQYYSENWSWYEDDYTETEYPLSEFDKLSMGTGMHDINNNGQIYGLYFGTGIADFYGEWYENKLNGYGKIHYENKSTVNFSTDLQRKDIVTLGEGYYKWDEIYKVSDDILSYCGYYLNDEISSYGEIVYRNGNVYTGFIDADMIPYFGMYMWNFGDYSSFFIGMFNTEGNPSYGTYMYCEDVIKLYDQVIADDPKNIYLEKSLWEYDSFYDEDIKIIKHPSYGILEYGRFDTYTGMMKDDEKNGVGYLPNYEYSTLFSNVVMKPSYYGEFRDGKMEGYGQITWNGKEDICYIGYVSDGKPEGAGTYVYSYDEYIEGDTWSFTASIRKDTFFSQELDGTYIGMLLDDMRNGHGSQVFCGLGFDIEETGYVRLLCEYSGNWKNDRPYGYGIFGYNLESIEDFETWKNSELPECNAKNIIEGNWSWAENEDINETGLYTGMLCDNVINGYGILCYYTGEIAAGIWENGVLVDDELEILKEIE